MSENVSIKTEPIANDYDHENFNNVTHTLSYNATKLEHFTTMGNVIGEDELDLDKMAEFLPENVDISTIGIIKEEEVDEMDEFLPDDSHSTYTASSPTLKSDDRAEVITHDEVHQQHVTPQLLTATTTQQMSLPKLEIMDVHEDEHNSNDPEANDSEEGSLEVSIVSNKKVGKYKCKTCGKRYDQSKSLLEHVRLKHPSHTEYICEICQKIFTTQHGLNRHSTWTHPDADATQAHTKHKCEQCDRSYVNEKSLQRHMRNDHCLGIDKEYICEICNQRFTTKKGLVVHLYKTHPAEYHSIQTRAKHKCELCDSSYGEVADLRRHIRKRHPSSLDTEYICEICNQRFTTPRGLKKHYYWMHQGAHSTQIPIEHNDKQSDNSS
ncbi:uncharacterized protein isoform X1 [Musca autumnalis]|uniref:uncharacterized protein isoform X1 n=1 Tax=Musca autumnalis TaxID=221902 RepID=UPI003CFAA6F6